MSAQVQFQPSPLDLGGTFSTSWRVLKSNFWTFAALLLLPALVAIVEFVGFIAVMIWMTTPAFLFGTNTEAIIVVYFLLLIAGYFLTIVLTMRCTAAIYAGVNEVAQGRKPTVSSALAASPGLFGRMVLLSLLYMAVAAALVALFSLVMFAAIVPMIDDPYASAGPAIMIGVLLYLAGLAGAVYLGIKLYYLVPVMAVEGRGPIEAIRRSFFLTRGEFLRTLGYSLLASMIVTVPLVIVYYLLALLALVPIMSLDFRYGSGDVWSALGGSLIILIFATLVYVVGLVIAQLYITVFAGVMYVDRARRERGEVVMRYPGYGYQGYGQPHPGQPYPQQGPNQPYPGPQPGQPGPGQPYPQPGQPYPQQGPNQPYPGPQPGQPGPSQPYQPGGPGQAPYGQPGSGNFGTPPPAGGQPNQGQGPYGQGGNAS